jgi:hypothetical protein
VSSPPASDIRKTLDAFLLLAHHHAAATQHAKATPLADLARELGIADGLAEKVAVFLESEGMIDYDDQAVDITIPGILRAEKLLRGADGEDDAPAAKPHKL